MNIPTYRLFRTIIHESDRYHTIMNIREDDTHIICLEVEYNGDMFQSNPKSIETKTLKFMVRVMKGAIMAKINGDARKKVVTSIG